MSNGVSTPVTSPWWPSAVQAPCTHATWPAELDVSTVLVPQAAGVLSALGLAASDLRRDYVSALVASLAGLGRAKLEEAFASLEERAKSDLDGPELRRFADLRYRGQSFELTVRADDLTTLGDNFAATHLRRYGFDLPGERGPARQRAAHGRCGCPEAQDHCTTGGRSPAPPALRRAYFDGAWCEVPVYGRDVALTPGEVFAGPGIVELAGSTCVIPRGWQALSDHAGALVLERW